MTAPTRPLRFGLLSGAATPQQWRDDVARAEAEGYSTVVLTDHLDLSGAHVTRLSWMPAFADALARTTTLGVSVMVANQDLRHPAVLARDVVTLDRLGGGRVELGLGAGWVEREYDWAGLRFDPPAVRVDRLGEYAAVLRGLTTAGPESFSFSGKHFRISRMPTAPLPTHGRLPLMIGGSRRRVLSLAAGIADIVNLNTLHDDRPGDVVLAEKVGWVAEAAGDRFGELELAMSVPLVAGGDGSPADAVEAVRTRDPFAAKVTAGMSPERAADAAFILAGTTSAIVETLRHRYAAHHISYVVLPAHAADVMRPVLAALA